MCDKNFMTGDIVFNPEKDIVGLVVFLKECTHDVSFMKLAYVFDTGEKLVHHEYTEPFIEGWQKAEGTVLRIWTRSLYRLLFERDNQINEAIGILTQNANR